LTSPGTWVEDHASARIMFLALLLALTMITVYSTAQSSPKEVKSEMLVSTDWLAANLHDSNLVILCIADDIEFYSRGHIPGARLIRISDLVTTRGGIPNELAPAADLQKVFERAGVSNNSRIVLYGERSGILAARAYFTLDYLGVADSAALLDGGMEKWRAEHREEVRETPQIRPGSLAIRRKPSISANAAEVAEAIKSKSLSIVLLDARPGPEFSGSKFSEDVPKAGHIPGAQNLYWGDMLEEADIPVLRPMPELRQMMQARGAAPNQEIITYCRTGMQSSFDYFVAKYLGYPTRMYDGSFFEWSRKDLPVEKSSR
jgi:thiosulfate/3-mercaptopyruvate sulfurtransferase